MMAGFNMNINNNLTVLSRLLLNYGKCSASSIISKRCLNMPVYKGPFDQKKLPWTRPAGRERMSKLLDEVNQIRTKEIEPAPLHLVWRVGPLGAAVWQERVILRRLNLHDREWGSQTMQIIPNTPEYNKMLWEVKHLIYLRPVTFPDGIPTEEDIGATKINSVTGEMKISDSNRISEERLAGAVMGRMFVGKYLREYLKANSWIAKKSVIGDIHYVHKKETPPGVTP